MPYIEQNVKEFEVCGVTCWHKKGITGKGVRIAELESAYNSPEIFGDKLHDPFNEGGDLYINSHGQKVLDVMHQVAPDADLYMLPNGGRYSRTKASGDLLEKTIPYAEEEKINIIGASLGGNDNQILVNRIKKANEKGVKFITSAGNEGKRGLGGFARSNAWISVGAIGYNDVKDLLFLKHYSSRGAGLDIVSFSGLYVYNAKKYPSVTRVEGTSFSQPLVAGMAALVDEFFTEYAGRPLYQYELEQFMIDNVIDLGALGYDELYGHGLWVLPDPDTIDVYKYVEKRRLTYMFKDFDKIPQWGRASVEKLAGLDILQGDGDNNFNALNFLSRVEFAVALDRARENILKEVKKIMQEE